MTEAVAGRVSQPGRPIAILGAMPEEVELLLADLSELEEHSLAGVGFHSGLLDGRRVVVAASGIGKVNAAAATLTLCRERPLALLFTGVAGAVAPGLRVGDIVVARDAIQHDVDVTALDYPPARIPDEPLTWSSDSRLVELAIEVGGRTTDVRVVEGRVATGDQFLADPAAGRRLHEAFGATCVEMEGAAAAQVCAKAKVPFVIIRSISDAADDRAKMSFREFTELAAGRAKRLVRGMLPEIATRLNLQ